MEAVRDLELEGAEISSIVIKSIGSVADCLLLFKFLYFGKIYIT